VCSGCVLAAGSHNALVVLAFTVGVSYKSMVYF
jgi:hypothetical protein